MSPLRQRIAFLSATFPAETFVVREFEWLLRSSRLDVQAIAIRRPDGRGIAMAAGVPTCWYLRPEHTLAGVLAGVTTPLARPHQARIAMRLLAHVVAGSAPAMWGRLAFQFAAGAYLARRLPRMGFDAVHAHFDSAGSIALYTYLLGGLPYSLVLHASDDLYCGYKPLLDAKIGHARMVITNSEYNAHYINRLTHGRYAHKLQVVYNGIPLDDYRDAKPKTVLEPPVKLLTVGNFSGVKGYPTALAALRTLKDNGFDFEYRIIGDGDAEERDMLVRMIAASNLGPRVVLEGRQPFREVLARLAWCDVAVLPCEIGEAGKRDGLPNFVAEAMLACRPVVTTYMSDLPNVIRHGETGYLVPESSPAALAGALQDLVRRYETTITVVQRARHEALIRFNPDTNYGRLESLLVGS
jgi:glycosyltransferase involved in cell wall biosynthesis